MKHPAGRDGMALRALCGARVAMPARLPVRVSLLVPLIAALAIVFVPRHASAWYFPEHAEFTRLALGDFAPGFATEQIRQAAAGARLGLCPDATTALHALPTRQDYVACVPYGALAALAGDHARDVDELRAELANASPRWWPMHDAPLAATITDAARSTWIDFQARATPDAVRVWTMAVSRLDPQGGARVEVANAHDYVRTLDAELLLIDPGYVDRAKNAKTHFHDATRSVPEIIQQAVHGDVDNALAQALAHHARSLQLAARSRDELDDAVRTRLRADALLEHAFALHFIEDGFAAGHVATDPGVAMPVKRAQRHDYFNRVGLAVTRALASRRCASGLDDGPPSREMGLDPCWLAHGDGFAGVADRLYVGEAVARIQAAFALAIMPREQFEDWLRAQLASKACTTWLAVDDESDVDPEYSCDLAWTAILLDPKPASLGRSCGGSNEMWATAIVRHFHDALDHLESATTLVPADGDSPRVQPGVLPADVLGHPIAMLEAWERKPVDRHMDTPVGWLKRWLHVENAPACTFNDWQAVLWLPVLEAWPAAQADVSTLDGADSFGQGFDLQVLASVAASYASPLSRQGAASGWAGLGAGFAFNTWNVFPRRRMRPLFELNGGFAEGMLAAGPADADRFTSVAIAECRMPVTSLLLYGAGAAWHTREPLQLVGSNLTIGVFGVRAYWFLTRNADPKPAGWDIEVADLLLHPDAPAREPSSSGTLDPEGRLRIGWRAADVTQTLGGPFHGRVMLTVEINSGFFTTL